MNGNMARYMRWENKPKLYMVWSHLWKQTKVSIHIYLDMCTYCTHKNVYTLMFAPKKIWKDTAKCWQGLKDLSYVLG